MEPNSTRKTSVTVADVARAAGVSKATAARVLGGYGTVSDAVRENVIEAARQLDYRPNELARSMTTGRSGTIGVVVGDIENPFFGAAVRGISDVAKTAGFTVILANSGEDIDAERQAVAALLAKRVDGLIVTPSRTADIDHLLGAVQAHCPLVLLDRAIPQLAVDAVTVDDLDAAEAATDLLINRGHRRIAYITACDTPEHRFTGLDDIYTGSVRLRIEGFLAASEGASITAPSSLIRLGANTRQKTRDMTLDLLRLPDRPTAIIASDSLIALEVFKVIRDAGIEIPREISLITFHNADWTSVTSPQITVIDQPVYRLGEQVAKLLVDRMRGGTEPPRHVIVPTALIERHSVADRLQGSFEKSNVDC